MKKIIFSIFAFCMLLRGGIILSAPDSAAMFEQGIDAMRSGNYSSAELIFRRLSSEREAEIKDKSQFYLAQSIFYQKNYKSAIHEFTSYLNKCKTNSLCLESRYWLAESYYYLKEYGSAIEEYKRYLDKNKREYYAPFAHDRIGSIYYEQERYTEAIHEWEDAIKYSADQNANAMRTLNIGRSLFLNSQYDEALDRLAPLLGSRTDAGIRASATIICGRIYQSNDKHLRALALFNSIPEDLLKISPYSEARYFKALSLINRGDNANAKNQLEIYLVIAKNGKWYYHAMYEIGRLDIRAGETAKGLERLNEVSLSASPELRTSANGYLGNYYLALNPQKAVPYLEAAMNGESDDARSAKLSLADAYIKEKRADEAEKILTEYKAAYPYDSHMDKVKFLTARLHLIRRENQEAVDLFEAIKREEPFSEYIKETNLYLAEANYNEGYYQRAVALLNSYLSRNDIENRYEGLKLMTALYIEMKYLNAAKGYVNQIIAKYTDGNEADEIICRFALAYYENGSNADWYISKAEEKFPNSESLHLLYLSMGNSAFNKKKYTAAIGYYDKYLQTGRRQDRETAFYNTVLATYNLKQYGKVTDMLTSGAVPPLTEEQWTEIPFILARCYGQSGSYRSIYTLFRPADTPFMPDDVFFLYMKGAASVGDMELILSNMERLSKNGGYSAEILYSAANWYKANGNMEKAMSLYSDIAKQYPASDQADFAAYEYAKLLYEQGQAKEAADNLLKIKNRTLRDDKNSLLILCYFSNEDYDNAVKLSDSEITRLAKRPEAKEIVNLNLLYHFEGKRTAQFKKYAYYMQTWFKDTQEYVSCMQGRYSMLIKDYSSAFAWFSRAAASENEYTLESLFHLGEISLLVNKKPQQAAGYFEQIVEKSRHSDYGYMAVLELARIYGESSRTDEAKMILKDVMSSDSQKYAVQAENIYNALQLNFNADEKTL